MKPPPFFRICQVAGFVLCFGWPGWAVASELEGETPEDAESDSLAEAETDRAQDRFSRETPEMAAAWASVLEGARRSTARIFREGKPIALATAVNEKGWLITKASELHDGKGKAHPGLTV